MKLHYIIVAFTLVQLLFGATEILMKGEMSKLIKCAS